MRNRNRISMEKVMGQHLFLPVSHPAGCYSLSHGTENLWPFLKYTDPPKFLILNFITLILDEESSNLVICSCQVPYPIIVRAQARYFDTDAIKP